FGRFSKASIGWSALARNAALMAIAGYLAADGLAAPAFAGVFLLAGGLWVWLGPLSSRPRAPQRPAPDFALVDARGATWTLASVVAAGLPALLVFSQSGCPACQTLLPQVGPWQRELRLRLRVVVVTGSPRSEAAREVSVHGLGLVLTDESGAVARAYGVHATPSAVLVDQRGRIAGIGRGAGEIADLVAGQAGEGAIEAEPRVGRRTVLGRGLLSLLPVVAAACGGSAPSAKRPKSLHIDGAYLCDQRYALCTNAPCAIDSGEPSIATCDCVVKTGYAIGFKSCTERAARGTTLYSNFSTQLVTTRTKVLSCPAEDRWANCLDVVCTVDPHDSTKAHCQCLLVDKGPSVTFGGNCDQKTCSSTIWSAATPNLPGSAQLEKGMKQLGLPLTLPKSCPSGGNG
ncbi:MAG: TlpA family protein disulfide reductase, partial [Candidatus Dormibacteraceae bacterium]